MPDYSSHDSSHGSAVRDWNAAFAQLPLETPPDGGWTRLNAALNTAPASSFVPAGLSAQRSRRHRRWRIAAAAAVIAPVLGLSLLWTRGADDVPPHGAATTDTGKRPTNADAAPALSTATIPPGDAPNATDATRLAHLQGESAQLEALVALTRDDQVGSGTAVAMRAAYIDRIGLIDSALVQQQLKPEQRLLLWERRVQALRSLAGVETTDRWLAAHGGRYDDAMVRVD